jgi:hypothetical protein
MGLRQQWEERTGSLTSRKQLDDFWKTYFDAEQKNYEKILESGEKHWEGTVLELSGTFGMDPVTFAGFLDGVNTSLETAVDLDALEEDTALSLDIDFEKLFWNMHEAKADWLYGLKQWDGILPAEKREELAKAFRKSKIAVADKVGRNEPCPCGSGKKYKNCCGA